MTRRQLFGASLAAALLRAKSRTGRSRIGAISDEIALNQEGAIAFARQYGLHWLELRSVRGGEGDWKGEYGFLPEAHVREAAKAFKDNGIRISYMDTSLLKFPFPGSQPVRKKPESEKSRAKHAAGDAEKFERRMDDLRKAIDAAHILGATNVRVFAFSRVENPPAFWPRVVPVIEEMVEVAAKEKIHLLIENEASTNVGTTAEAAEFLKLIPSKWFGLNWDSLNGLPLGENPYPDGYRRIPMDRLGNVQIKGKTVLDYPEHLDWKAMFEEFDRDGYQGVFGLETHIFGEGQVQASHDSMKEILRILGEA
jgi:sugar phosphate isomerase/epimerase